jgi:outer membrane protein assembly factor BamB
MRHGHRTALALLGLAALTSSATALGDSWPIARHDAARTGASGGTLATQSPLVTWRAYMGGRPSDATARFGLADPAIMVAATGGRIVAKDVKTQATLWKSDLLGGATIADLADLDGDGAAEVVVAGETRVHVLDGQTGASMWASAVADFHAIAGVRVVDLNGDGLPDVYVDECESCANTGTKTAGAYSFAGGLQAPVELWSRPIGAPGGGLHSGSDSIVDLDEDGIPEIVLASDDEISLVRGDNGAAIATLQVEGAVGKPFPHASAIAAELDGQPGLELLVIQPNGQVLTQSGPAGVTAFRVSPATGQWSHLFSADAGDYDGEIATLADIASDVDGDGQAEIVLSWRSSTTGGSWVTRVLDGATGDILGEIADARLEGTAALDAVAGDEICVSTAAGLALYSWGAGGLTALAGPIPGLRAFTFADPALRRAAPVAERLAVLPHPGKRPLLLAGHPSSADALSDRGATTTFTDVVALELTGAGTWVTAATFTPPTSDVNDLVRADSATRPYPQVAVGSGAGTITVLDWTLRATNGLVWQGGQPVGTRVGGAKQMATGAYGSPLVATDGDGPFVVLPGTPDGLLVGDARQASWIVPPAVRWVAQGFGAASAIDLGPLGYAIVGVAGHDLVARGSVAGDVLGSAPLGAGQAAATPLPLRAAGAASPLVGIDWRIEGVQIVQTAVDFASSSVAWAGAPLAYGGFFGSGVGDLDGDGTDAWYSMNGPLNVRDAVSGALATFPALSTGYALPMIADLTGDDQPDLLLQASGAPPMLVGADLQQKWLGPEPEPLAGMAGARVDCPTGPRFVSPAVRSPYLRVYDGATGSILVERVLAGGQVFGSIQAAQAVGKEPGLLGNASAVAAMGGAEPAVLAGSTDGYLYALSGCTLDPIWTRSIGAPVAEPIIGDLDGDGSDEIVVGASDGYVYGFDDPVVLAPAQVQIAGASDGSVPVGGGISASWPAVEGATSYEVALVSPDETPVWSPPYREVNGTSLDVELAGALAGRPYRIAVRAVAAEGKSPDALSATVTVHDDEPPTATAKGEAKGPSAAIVHATTQDDLALDSFVLRARIGAGDGFLVAADGVLSGAQSADDVEWEVPEEALGQDVTLALDVYDSAGNMATATLGAHVGEDGAVTFTDGPSDQPPATDEAGGQSFEVSNGCACDVTGAARSPSPLVWAALASMIAARAARRRRTS